MKIFSKILSAITVLAVTAGCAATAFAEENTEAKKPESLLVLGDSIASGYGLEGYKSGDNYSAENYGSMLKESYGINSESYHNFAKDGQTSQELYEKISSGEYDEYLDSDVIVISIGGNDLLGVILSEDSVVFKETNLGGFLAGEVTILDALQGADLLEISSQLLADAEGQITAFEENMPKIINIIKDKNPDAMIVLQTLYNPMNTGVEVIDSLYGSTISKLNDVIYQTEYCFKSDVYTAFEDAEGNLIQSDYTHPNAEGHRVIFEAVKKTIDENFYIEEDVETDVPTEPTVTQPVVTTTTTATTTTEPPVTTTAPAVTTTVVTTTTEEVTEAVDDEDDKTEEKDLIDVLIPVGCIIVGLAVITGIVFINKKRKK